MSSSQPGSSSAPPYYINHSKLHPIYVALEASQHTKAIKLCLQQPDNLMAQALLAHSYAKLGQRSASLLALGKILPEWLPELRMEIQQVRILERQRQRSAGAADAAPTPPHGKHHTSSSASASATATAAAPAPAPPAAAKSKQKGKGKRAAKTSAAPPSGGSSTSASYEDAVAKDHEDPIQDSIDRLDDPPRLPLDWDQRRPSSASSTAQLQDPRHRLLASDETLLSTVAMLTRNSLGMPLTCFQILSWAAAVAAATSPTSQQSMKLLRDAYCTGFHVLVSPRYAHVVDAVLAQMQGIAMQLAKQHPRHYSTAWAAQTALWQYQHHQRRQQEEEKVESPPGTATDATKSKLFLRLAESLALKALEHPLVASGASSSSSSSSAAAALVATDSASTASEDANTNSTLLQSEPFLLYLRVLQASGQHHKVLEAVQARLDQATSAGGGDQSKNADAVIDNDAAGNGGTSAATFLVQPPRRVLIQHKVRALVGLERFGEAREAIEAELLRLYPDDWSCWKQHLHCSMEGSGPEEGIGVTEAYLTTVLDCLENGGATDDFPLRGPHLMRVEIAAERLRRAGRSRPRVDDLVDAVVAYGAMFAPRSACTFSDLLPYVELAIQLDTARDDNTAHLTPTKRKLLEWLREFGAPPESTDAKMRRRELRVYIFSTQLMFKLVADGTSDARQQWIPGWVDMLSVWKSFQAYDQVSDETMKENRPADELILLAIQRLIRESSTIDLMKFHTAASVLEAAIEYSPHNPHLKILALFVYGQLNAAPRAWTLFQTLHVKHIQYESLSYLILPILWSGGMYVEAVCVCKDILRLQRSAAQDTGEYAGRAMDNSALSKADEFVRFHRDRMNRSLTCLEAKGIILEGAPLYVQDGKQPSYGAMQGIVGGPDDTSRVYEILANVMDPFSAFSVLQLSDPPRDFTDNRDFDVLSQDLLIRRSFPGIEDIAHATMRRGLVQGLLIRSALVKELTKGPRKGKVVPPSDALRKRCKSLLSCASVARRFCDASVESPQPRNLLFMRILILECHILTVLSSGLVTDSLEEAIEIQDRERIVCSHLDQLHQAIDTASQLDLCVASVSQMLPECLLPSFTLFNMCSEVLDLFGWGKRKSKKCAEGLAVTAQSLCCVVGNMISCLKCLSQQASQSNPYRNLIVPEFVTEESYSRTAYSIAQSQMLTMDSILRVMVEIQATLQTFNNQE